MKEQYKKDQCLVCIDTVIKKGQRKETALERKGGKEM